MELTVQSLRRAAQSGLDAVDYSSAMLAELEDLDEMRLSALDHLVAQKKRYFV